MLSRRFQYSTSSIIIVLIVLGILAVVSFMSTRYFVRADLTQGKDFTISHATKKVLDELDDIVNINVHFSKKLPPYLAELKRRVKDILDEYKAFARGNLVVEFIDIDPEGDPTQEQKVRFMGIPKVPAGIIEKDKTEVVNVYRGIAVMYGGRTEVIPVVQNVMNLEYDLTSAIIKVKRAEAKTIGFLTGHGEYDTEEDYENVKSSLEKQYNVVNVDISEGKEVPEDVDTLIVGGPKEKLSERHKYEIDQFLMRGGRIIFLVDPIDVSPRGISATQIDSNLNDMLEHYGVRLGGTLVIDTGRRSHAYASFSMRGYAPMNMPYYFWPRITGNRFAKDSPMVNELESLVLPWAGPVELVSSKVDVSSEDESEDKKEDSKDTSKLRGTELFRSSQSSWTKGRPFNLSPQQPFISTGEKSYPMAVAVSGRFKSFYADKSVPEPEKSDDEDSSEVKPSGESSADETITESSETQIIVVGSARFATNMFLAQFGFNRLFFENAVDWLTLGEDLINIRSRFVTNRPLKEISEKSKLFVRVINYLGAPLLVIGFGLARFIFKRRAKKIFETYSALGGTG